GVPRPSTKGGPEAEHAEVVRAGEVQRARPVVVADVGSRLEGVGALDPGDVVAELDGPRGERLRLGLPEARVAGDVEVGGAGGVWEVLRDQLQAGGLE